MTEVELSESPSSLTAGATTVGGRRRRGTKRGRKGKKGTRKGRRGPTKWINHVKSYARQHGIKFGMALRDKKCSAAFKRG